MCPRAPSLPNTRSPTGPTRSIVQADQEITFSRNPAWKAETDPVRKAYVDKVVIDETVSQESQQQLQTGRPADMEFNNFPPPSQLPG